MSTYDQDVVAWSQEQAHLLRIGQFSALDIEHLAEEIEDVGRSEQRELASRMAVLLAHLLKWRYQPERRGVSGQVTISSQRERLRRRLEKTPSLKAVLSDPDWWADAWLDARIEATQETGIEIQRFPPECPWTADEILDPAGSPPNAHLSVWTERDSGAHLISCRYADKTQILQYRREISGH